MLGRHVSKMNMTNMQMKHESKKKPQEKKRNSMRGWSRLKNPHGRRMHMNMSKHGSNSVADMKKNLHLMNMVRHMIIKSSKEV